MRLKKAILSTALIMLSTGSFANADDGAFGSNLSSIVEKLPDTLKKPLETYIEVVRPSAYGTKGGVEDDNLGMIQYFHDQVSAPNEASRCLNLRVQLFYNYVLSHDLAKAPATAVKTDPMLVPYPALSDDGAPSMDSSMKDYGREPGWVWKKAMQLTNENPDEAMKVIGICGHDNIGLRGADSFNTQNVDQLLLAKLQKKYGKKLGSVGTKFSCPNLASAFYVPGALGSEVDIPDELKTRIEDAQIPPAGPHSVKTEYYHVYASAYMGCQMVQNGVPADRVPFFASKFASVYRRRVACDNAISQKEIADRINKKYQADLAKKLRTFQDAIGITDWMMALPAQDCHDLLVDSEFRDRLCTTDESKKMSRTDVEALLATFFAGKMYYEQQGCPDAKHSANIGVSEMLRFVSAVSDDAFDFGRAFSCQNIPLSICGPANQELESLRVFFEWTMTQHKIGSAFGAKLCAAPPPTAVTCNIPGEFFMDSSAIDLIHSSNSVIHK